LNDVMLVVSARRKNAADPEDRKGSMTMLPPEFDTLKTEDIEFPLVSHSRKVIG
jgi:hypothetical protein